MSLQEEGAGVRDGREAGEGKGVREEGARQSPE
eukprot:CAMPEP_0180172504 /NCGR_PEP_ID=MMETSP0986-20121125/35060_1 /TAXON_ID=697907 /ORGANISM="non described non described, Strain CCMP2293" /LENGTH=32 /DNA_ID= /DNA_START= /DNA_END= /DNA_ORIENTATION=